MNKIGSGWQCDVYDLKNGRVIKHPKKKHTELLRLVMDEGPRELLKGMIRKATQGHRDSLIGLKDKLKDPGLNHLLGNPQIDYETFSYLQEKVIPLRVYWKLLSIEDKKKLLERYVELNKTLWKYGIHETIYNFSINVGVNERGELIVMDLGELVFDKEEAIKDVHKKPWLDAYSYQLLPGSLKSYYKKVADQHLTFAALESSWPHHR